MSKKQKSAIDMLEPYMFPHSPIVKQALKEAHDCVSESYWKMREKELLKPKYIKAVKQFIKVIKKLNK